MFAIIVFKNTNLVVIFFHVLLINNMCLFQCQLSTQTNTTCLFQPKKLTNNNKCCFSCFRKMVWREPADRLCGPDSGSRLRSGVHDGQSGQIQPPIEEYNSNKSSNSNNSNRKRINLKMLKNTTTTTTAVTTTLIEKESM